MQASRPGVEKNVWAHNTVLLKKTVKLHNKLDVGKGKRDHQINQVLVEWRDPENNREQFVDARLVGEAMMHVDHVDHLQSRGRDRSRHVLALCTGDGNLEGQAEGTGRTKFDKLTLTYKVHCGGDRSTRLFYRHTHTHVTHARTGTCTHLRVHPDRINSSYCFPCARSYPKSQNDTRAPPCQEVLVPTSGILLRV